MQHYNHLHTVIPVPLGETSARFLNLKNLSFIFQLAIERDNDSAFHQEMFAPRIGARSDVRTRIEIFHNDWIARSKKGMPSLLSVWLTPERRKQLWGLPR